MLDRIGIGGMGVVWQAMDERLQRLVAVKQLLLQAELSPQATGEARARALREARIAARLHHPNAIVVYDVAEHEGQPCLVMEYLPSRSLAAVLGERGALPVPDVASIGWQIALALAAAHAARIVHRDVKPGNILITDDGTAKITDFGVSRAVGDITVTQTGMVAGTPAYLAPEVARGQIPTSASDVFSLGATLYAAVEGRGPFGESDNPLALLHAVASGQVQPPRHAGPLSAVLLRLLATDPAARPDMRRASLELAEVRTSRAVPSATSVPRFTPMSRSKSSRSNPGPRSTPMLSPTRVTQLVEPPEPADGFAVHPRRRPGRGVLVGAVLAVLAFTGVGALVSTRSSAEHAVRSTAPGATAAAAPAPAVPSAPPRVERVDNSRPIAWSDAGQLVIDYYNGLDNPASAWQLLSPTAQAVFGTESQFQSHWSQYSSVSARNAFGVTDNSDGSVRVPVDVTYTTGGTTQVIKQALRVTRLNGRLLIDSDPR
ncbi:MAG: serine/threonine-protein kinase [Pseudonocardiaceae bacterium]